LWQHHSFCYMVYSKVYLISNSIFISSKNIIMKDFNIAKYLRENSLGSHAILGAYVDLHALKEVENIEGLEPVKDIPILVTQQQADLLAKVCIDAGMTGVKAVEIAPNKFKIYADPGQETKSIRGNLNKEADYGNNEPVDEVPYVGAEEKLDGFGDEFDQVAPVEEAMSAWEEKLSYYESEVNDLVYDMMETTGADIDQIADFFQYISTQIRNKSNFGSMEEGMDDDDEDLSWMKDDRFADLGGDQIKAGIKSLVDDGFDTREIAQFVVDTIRAFKSFKEEVTVSSSGVEMEEVAGLDDEHGNVYKDLDIIAKKIKKAGAMLQYDEFGDSIIVMVTTKDGDSQLQKAIYKEVKQLIKKNHPAFVVSPIEKDSPGRISFSVDYFPTNMEESLEEAEMYTVDFGTNTQDFELDRDRNVLIGLKPQMGLPGSSRREQDIIPVMIDANGYLSTKDPRVKDISPKSNANPFSDPGYMNRD